MLRTLLKFAGLTALLIAGTAAIVVYQNSYSTTRKIEKLEEDKKQLEQIVTRLEGERRVADVLVSRQETVDGVLLTTLLFVEYDRQGQPLPAKSFVIQGKAAHLDAMVIKFDHDFVAHNDALRGHSIALFTSIYGERQSPSEAMPIDQPGKIPDVYRAADPKVSDFEMSLWRDFWKLYEDEDYRKSKGVRALGGHGVWGPFESNRLYTITVESDGGLNMTSEPLKGIYRELLKQRSSTTQPSAT